MSFILTRNSKLISQESYYEYNDTLISKIHDFDSSFHIKNTNFIRKNRSLPKIYANVSISDRSDDLSEQRIKKESDWIKTLRNLPLDPINLSKRKKQRYSPVLSEKVVAETYSVLQNELPQIKKLKKLRIQSYGQRSDKVLKNLKLETDASQNQDFQNVMRKIKNMKVK